MNRNNRLALVILAILITVAVIMRSSLGSTPVIKLGAGPALAGSVSQSLYNGGHQGYVPIEGIDYTLQNTKYFDNGTWVITTVSPIKQTSFDTSLVVLNQGDGFYQAVLGPGSAFPSSALRSLPSDVGQYLKTKGVIYGP